MTSFLKLGKQTEKEFAQVLTNTLGGTITNTSKKDDIFKHIDLYWNGVGIDVKGIKREYRNGNLNDKFHWIELRNVNGDKGWLFGEAKLFAFETFNSYLLIKKSTLIKFIKNKVKKQNINNTPSLYSYYRRKNRLDVVVKVLTSDLEKISVKILYK